MGLPNTQFHKQGKSASSNGLQRRRTALHTALRMYRCARCGQVALLCRHCEHGQIYCAQGCAQQARKEHERSLCDEPERAISARDTGAVAMPTARRSTERCCRK